MKIHLIPLGTRFLFKGQIYTKVGPMTAAGESSGVEFIPKHAALQPVPGEAPPPPPPEKRPALDLARITAAFERYHRSALECVDDAGRVRLEQARARFLAELG